MAPKDPVDLLVSDVDRTLLTHDYVLLTQVIEALAQLQQAGVKIVLASARSPEALRPYALKLGVTDLAICFNGGWIGNLDSGASISTTTIDRSDALAVMDTAARLRLAALWYEGGRVYTLEQSQLAEREVAVTGEKLSMAGRLSDLPGEPGKIMCVRANPDNSFSFDSMHEQFSPNLSVARSHWRLLEIGPQHVSKRVAIERVAQQLGVKRDNCGAAGDAENDLQMLQWAATAITVGNAIDDIKRVADFIGPSCDEGGMAVAAKWLQGRRQSM
jgi:Cof subfamily protein (haloacid dehalogenase superfamily)